MRSLRPILALFLAILWIPLTAHCGMETAGVLPQAESAGTSCCDHGDNDSHDTCSVAESGDYTSHITALKVMPPDVATFAAILLSPDRLIAVSLPGYETCSARARPRDWVCDWYFVRRAASPPRAPSQNA